MTDITRRISTHDLTRRSTAILCKKFSIPNHFLCLLHIIYSYYINTIFFSTLFLQNLHFFWCESPRIFLFTCLSHSAFCSLFILILLIIEPLSYNIRLGIRNVKIDKVFNTYIKYKS